MKEMFLRFGRKLNENYLIIGIALSFTLMLSCNKNKELNDGAIHKEPITINNLGEIHNYLLSEYANHKLKSASSSKTFGDVFKEFETLLINSEKYSTASTIKSSLTEDERNNLLDKFADIKMDANFHNEFKDRFIEYFQNVPNIDEELRIKILETTKDYSSISITDDIANNSGYNFVLAYNNVYSSSTTYWEEKGVLKSTNMSDNQKIIWSDAAGAAVGFMCGGFMSLLMGAATSNMVAEGIEMYE